MKRFIFFMTMILISFVITFKIKKSNDFHMACPSHIQASVPEVILPFSNISLKASLEIFSGSSVSGTPLQTFELATSFVSKQSGRAHSPQLIRIASTQLDSLNPGVYTFRVSLIRQFDDLLIAQLETTSEIRSGSSVNFDQAAWNYDFDEDGDFYNNITEIMNGGFITTSEALSEWVFSPTNPKDVNNHPERVVILRPIAISSMALGTGGRLLVAGDPLSCSVWSFSKR